MLSLSPGDEIGWKWAAFGDVPANAVHCGAGGTLMEANSNNNNNCYLGVSLYSDGICSESIGKIDLAEGLMYMSIGRESFVCPFFMFLTIDQASTITASDNMV